MCDQCLVTEKQRNDDIIRLRKLGKEYAIRDQKLYSIYNESNGSVGLMETSIARAHGIPSLEFISHFVPDANDGVS